MFKNLIWDYIGRFGNFLVSFLISIVLTRLLTVSEFGIMAMVMVVITMAHIFMDMGFNRAIIQSRNVTSIQLSTVFYINVFAAVFLMMLCFLIASPLAVFYKQPLIKPVFQVISISFLLNGLNLIPSALIFKQLQIKVNSFILLIASVFSGVVGIILAYNGFGVWSLVVQSLLSSFIVLVLNAWYIKWWPSWAFNFPSIKPLWHYGGRMFASGLLDRLYTRLDSFIIGKLYSANTLGYYYRAQSMEGFVRTFSAGGIMETLFPYIARHQDDPVYLKQLYIKYLHFITFTSVALSAILFLISKDLFIFLFTDRWIYAARLFQLMILGGILWPVSSLMVNIISGVGNSKSFFRLEVYKKIILLPIYIFGFIWGLNGFIISFVGACYICLILNMAFVSKEIDVSVKEQSAILGRYVITGIVTSLVSYWIFGLFGLESHIFRIIIYTGVFSVLFLGSCYILKFPGIEIIFRLLSKLRSFISK
ncbi:MAG: lipopolysaccharide biosynthesis protein [Ferruginibacter sp.]